VGTNVFIPVGLILTSAVALIGPGLALWTLILWIVIGAVFGSGVSYALGTRLGSRMRDRWPFKYRRNCLSARTVFERYGIVAVFIGYFIGPLRGPVPVAAGIAGMPYAHFYLASVLSAVVWALTVVAPAAVLGQSFGPNDPILLLTPIVVPALTIGVMVAAILLRRFCASDIASPSKR
jgi:membrane protein DedA with SNARE-associated domain